MLALFSIEQNIQPGGGGRLGTLQQLSHPFHHSFTGFVFSTHQSLESPVEGVIVTLAHDITQKPSLPNDGLHPN
jgi:hypothetical protein